MLKKLPLLLALVGTPPLPRQTTMGDDGLHKTDWMRDTFRDMADALEEVNGSPDLLADHLEKAGQPARAAEHAGVENLQNAPE